MKKILCLLLILLGALVFDMKGKEFNSDLIMLYSQDFARLQYDDRDATLTLSISPTPEITMKEQVQKAIHYADEKELPLIFRTNESLTEQNTRTNLYFHPSDRYQYQPLEEKYYLNGNTYQIKDSIWFTTNNTTENVKYFRFLNGFPHSAELNEFRYASESELWKELDTKQHNVLNAIFHIDSSQTQTIINDLKSLYGNTFQIAQPLNEMTSEDDYLENLLFCLTLLFICICTYMVMKKDREIAILTLNGRPPLYATYKTIGKLFLLLNGIFLATIIICYIFIVRSFDALSLEFFASLMKYEIYLLFGSVFALILFYIHCHHIHIINTLKGVQQYDLFFLLGIGIKIILIFITAFPLYEAIHTTITIYHQYQFFSAHEVFLSDYAFLSHFEQLSYEQGNQTENQLKTYLKDDVLFASTLYLTADQATDYCYDDQNNIVECDNIGYIERPQFYMVNHNFIKQFPVYDRNGQKVTLHEKEEYTLIPISLKDQTHEISYRNIIYIKDDTKLPNLDMKRVSTTPYISNQIIRVLPVQHDEFSLDDVLIPINQEKAATPQIQNYFKNYEKADSIDAISYYEYLSQVSKQTRIQLRNTLFQTTIMILIAIFISYLNVYLYFHIYRKQLAIQYLHGKTHFESYRTLYALQFLSIIVGLILALLLKRILWKMFILELGFFLLIELVVSLCLIKRNEKKIAIALKGDE